MIVRKIKEIKEVSIVEEPANKHARIIQFTDDKGITREFYELEKNSER